MAKTQQPGPIQTCLGFLLMCVLIVGGCGLYFESRQTADQQNIEPPQKQTPPQAHLRPANSGQRGKSIEGQFFLISMLTDLDSFRGSEEFKTYGFGVGGKYHRWITEMESVKSRPDHSRFTLDEQLTCGNLMALGMEYFQSRNEENDRTRFFRKEVQQVITP